MTWTSSIASIGGAVAALLLLTLALGARDENTIEASVTIRRGVEEVFRFYRDFKNLPSFMGDVMAVEQIGPATSRWTIQGPCAFE